MLIIFLVATLAYCQLQLNPVSGKNFFYKVGNIGTNGGTLQVMQPTLGFQIQGGFMSRGLNQSLQFQNIISTSLFQQMNLIGILYLDQNYTVQTITYNMSCYLNTSQQFMGVSSAFYTCQNLQIIGYVNIVLHCLNITSNQITIYFLNQSQTTFQFNTGYSISSFGQLISTNISYYYYNGSYQLYFIYMCKYQSSVLQATLFNNTLSNLTQIWSYPAQFITIFVSSRQEIFALFQFYLLFQYKQQQVKFNNPNGLNWINMYILEGQYYTFEIFLVDTGYVYDVLFQYKFFIRSFAALPNQIQSAQIYSNLEYIMILTNSLTWGFQYGLNTISLLQQSQLSVLTQFNLYSSLYNLLISIKSTGIGMVQLTDYYLFNNQPNQTGFLGIGLYETNQILFIDTLYVNVVQNHSNQICPNKQNFTGVLFSTQSAQQQSVDLSQYYVGSNLTYQVMQTSLQGTFMLDQILNTSSNIQPAAIYAISQLNALLMVIIQQSQIIFLINQYDVITKKYIKIQQYTEQYSVDLYNFDFQIYFIEQYNSTIVVLFFIGFNNVQAFVLDPYQGVTNSYNIQNLDFGNGELQQGVTFFNYFIPPDGSNVFQINSDGYSIINTNSYNLGSFGVYQYGQQCFLFNIIHGENLDTFIEIEVYVWIQDQFQVLKSLDYVYEWYQYVFFCCSFDIFSVSDGIFIVNNGDTIVFIDKSFFLTTILPSQDMFFQIPTTQPFQMMSSLKFLYILTKVNSTYYMNIYQGTSVLDALYKSIYLNITSQQLNQGFNVFNVTTDFVQQCDYLTIEIQNLSYYSIIPHKIQYYQIPYNIYTSQYNIFNTFQVSNGYNQELFNVNFSINQPNIILKALDSISLIYDENQGSITLNPLSYFSGLIQNYSVSCQKCQEISLSSIIPNQQVYWNYSTIYSAIQISNGIQSVYTLNQQSLNSFIIPPNQQTQGDVTNNIITIATFNSSNIPVYMFIEEQTNSLTWLVNQIYILTIYAKPSNTPLQINFTFSQFDYTNQALLAIYNDGFLQIVTQSYYYCYYYQIINQTISIQSILLNVQISVLPNPNNMGFLNVSKTKNNYVFGIHFQDIYSRLQFLLLDVTFNDGQIQLNGYNKFYPNLQTPQLNINQIILQQYGLPVLDQNSSTLQLLYSSNIFCGLYQVKFLGIDLIYSILQQQFQLLDTDVNNNNINLIAQNGIQIAILSYTQNSNNNSLIVQIYQYGQPIPYYYSPKVFFSNQQSISLNYLASNILLLSDSQQTHLVNVNQFLTINYKTNTNSIINLIASNPINSAQIVIEVGQSGNSSQLGIIWIVSVVLVCLAALISIVLLLCKCKKGGGSEGVELS